LWSAVRTVTKNATIQLWGNTYQVDPVLAGRKIEAVYDPYDLAKPIDIWCDQRPAGTGKLQEVKRHVHAKAAAALRDEQQGAASGPATGVDYLAMVAADRRAELAAAGLDYTTLSQDAPADSPDEHGAFQGRLL
jgi:putative transposase